MTPASIDRPARTFRWLRMLAIATGAVILASCRSLAPPAVVSATAVTALPGIEEEAVPTADDMAAAPPATPQQIPSASWKADVPRAAPAPPEAAASGNAIVRTGLETPCPPLPRLGRRICRGGRCPADTAPCGANGCPPAIAPPCEPPPPLAGPCLVCDGGDHCAPAQAVGRDGLRNLTAGDTVARYRADDVGPDADEVHVTASNCACVFAPRFSSVREVVKPFEDAVPQGPRGLALDTLAGQEIRRQPVWGSTQNVAAEAARKALPGVAVEEQLGPLAVDQADLPHEDEGRLQPAVGVADEQPELAQRTDTPLITVGFDVPVAWTCVKGANVLVNGQAADSVAVDHGTATLRFEEPGRAALTLCKRAGSDTARTGEELDFTIFMLNSGDRPLTDIVLVDALPSRLRLIPESPAANLPAAFTTEEADDGAVVLKWRIGTTLQPGESGFVRFRTLVQ